MWEAYGEELKKLMAMQQEEKEEGTAVVRLVKPKCALCGDDYRGAEPTVGGDDFIFEKRKHHIKPCHM